MRIGDWIDAQRPVVPAGFRPCLQADGPASPAGFAAAAAEALAALAPPGGPAPMGTTCVDEQALLGAGDDAPSKHAEQSSAARRDGSGPAQADEQAPLGAGDDAPSKRGEQSSAARRGGSGGRARDRDRRAAFTLLALDAYVTYACFLALGEDDATAALEDVAAIVTRQWPPPPPEVGPSPRNPPPAPAQDPESRQERVAQAPAERRAPGPAPERAS